MRIRTILLVSAVLVGCNSDKHPKVTTPDASTPIDAPPLPPGCDYAELLDTTNDIETQSGVAEDTGITDGVGKVFCGNVDMSHFNATTFAVDSDAFKFTIAADSTVRIDLYGAGLEALDEVDVDIGDTMGPFDSGIFFTNHAVVFEGLPAGDYTVDMAAFAQAAPTATAPVPYKIKVSAYSLATACPKATGTATHTEGATDNDLLTVKFNSSSMTMDGFRHETTKTTDAVESSGITLAAGTNASIAASIGTGAALDADDYLERDTFELQTGNANELLTRIDWGTGATDTTDIDFFLLQKLTAPLATGKNWFGVTSGLNTQVGASGTPAPPLEVGITAVDPSSAYWLWAGAYKGSTANKPYTVTLCPSTFTSPQ